MAEHLNNALSLGQNVLQFTLSHLPEPAQHIFRTPLAQKALALLAVLHILRVASRSLSHRTLNNWQSIKPWDARRELVLLSGGCSGIGKQTMIDLVKTGVKIVMLDLNEPDFELPSNVFFYRADVTSASSIKAAATKIRAEHDEPTILINNAGVGTEGTILEKPEETIQRIFQVNTVSHFWMVREFLPAMIKQNHGHVITIASMASFTSLGAMVDYSCTKASALAFHEGLTQELRVWYKADKVRTSIIHPQWVRTPMIQMLSDAGKEFKMPIMGPEVVSEAVVKQIVSQSSGQVILPSRNSALSCLRAAPIWLQEVARNIGSRMLKDLKDKEPMLRKRVQ